MSYIDKGIKIALDAAYDSDCPTYKIGAALMKRNQTISVGRNIFMKSHTQSRTLYNGIHAEFNCLHGLNPDKCKRAILFVARITKAGSISMARPCEGCRELLRRYCVRVFYYTDYNGNVVKEVLNG